MPILRGTDKCLAQRAIGVQENVGEMWRRTTQGRRHCRGEGWRYVPPCPIV